MSNIFTPIEKNIQDKDYVKKIYNYLTSIDFDWHFMEDTTFENSNMPQHSTPAFGNLIYNENNISNLHLDFFKPLLSIIEKQFSLTIIDLKRIRAGFLLNTKFSLPSLPYKYNTPHRDFDQEHFVVIYYVNYSDGDTIIFHETDKAEKYYPMHTCTPEAGKLLLFNGWHYHASTCPKMCTKRIVITFNFTGKING